MRPLSWKTSSTRQRWSRIPLRLVKEPREAHAHEDFPEQDDENRTKPALSWLDKPYGEVAEVALKFPREVENLIDQAALESYSAEARKEPREAHAHEDFPEQDDENWTKPALSWLDKPFGEVAEVALKFCADFCCTL